MKDSEQKDFRLIDSSVWIDYLVNGNHKNIIDSDEFLLLSALSIFEIEKKLLKEKLPPQIIKNSMNFIKRRSLVIDVGIEIAEMAARVSLEKGLPAIDALIYSTALANNARLLTLDNDFKGLAGSEVLG